MVEFWSIFAEIEAFSARNARGGFFFFMIEIKIHIERSSECACNKVARNLFHCVGRILCKLTCNLIKRARKQRLYLSPAWQAVVQSFGNTRDLEMT